MGLRPLSGYSLAVRSHYKENHSAACPRNQDNKGKGADAEVMALSPSGKSVVETPAAPVPRVALGAQERGERSWTKCLKAWRHQKCLCHPKPKPPDLTGSPLWHPFCSTPPMVVYQLPVVRRPYLTAENCRTVRNFP